MNYQSQQYQRRPAQLPVPLDEKALVRLTETGKQISTIVNDCLPAITGNAADFIASLTIAKGVHDLKVLFLTSPEIRQVVTSMVNNRLGFLTDRTPAIIARNQRNGKYPNKMYSYEELVDPLIEGLLKGYRITNNEINIIAGQFYAAKNGNYRQILEYPGVTDFAYNNAPAQFAQDGRSARVKAWAIWKVNGKAYSIGVEPTDELLLQIRVNAGMGDDGILGKAQAKLFKRVLERLCGYSVPESTDIDVVSEAQVLGDADIPADPPQMAAENGKKPLNLYGGAETANQESDKPVVSLQQKLVSLLSHELGEEFVDHALSDARNAAAEQGLSSREFALKMVSFPQERKAWIDRLAGSLITESTPNESAPPEKSEKNYWANRSNWIHRRSVPFLMSVRIGMGLPFATGTLAKQDGDMVEIGETDRATYEQERRRSPDAWGTLLAAGPEAINEVRAKMTEKRSMGLAVEVFDQWLAEAEGIDEAAAQGDEPPQHGDEEPPPYDPDADTWQF